MTLMSAPAQPSNFAMALVVFALGVAPLIGCMGQSSRNGSSGDPPEAIGAWRFVDGGESRGLNSDADEAAKRPAVSILDERLFATWHETTAAGMDDFLAKPVRKDALKECFRRWVS